VIPEYLVTLTLIIVAFVFAAIVVRLARAAVHRTLRGADATSAERRAALHGRAVQLTRALTLLAYGVAALASISLALSHFGFGTPRGEPRLLLNWVLTHGINVIVIVVGAAIIIRAASLAIERLQHRLGQRTSETDLEWQRRASTLGGILTSLVTATVWFVATLMLLRELTIDVMPILTGAGIAGLAVGFGAQNLVRDVISGFFIILEDQVRVGDIGRINGVSGVVEQINLRTIVLRDGEGAVQVFPNGTVTSLANLSKQFAYAVVDVRAGYRENLDRVFGILREVGATLQSDPAWSPLLLSPLEVLGVESIADGFATIRIRFKTQPLNQGKVANELRRRVMMTMAGRGVSPYAG
jgi:small conductance mechanosensitive channel